MPLIISPMTSRRFVEETTDFFDASPLEETASDLYENMWYGNFKDNTWEAEVNGRRTFIMFTGYGGPTVMQALLHDYDATLRPHDDDPKAYYIGRVFVWPCTGVEPGDMGVIDHAISSDSAEQALYSIADKSRISDVQVPDNDLLMKIEEAAAVKEYTLSRFRTFCTMTPLRKRHRGPAQEILKEKWRSVIDESRIVRQSGNPDPGCYHPENPWRDVVVANNGNFNSGEYESAAFYAATKLIDLPRVALVDVKDRLMSGDRYKNIGDEHPSLHKLLEVIKDTI